MDVCPYCGGTSGISSTYKEKRICVYDWTGGLVESDHAISAEYKKTGKCLDCEKRVKIPEKKTP